MGCLHSAALRLCGERLLGWRLAINNSDLGDGTQKCVKMTSRFFFGEDIYIYICFFGIGYLISIIKLSKSVTTE